MLVQLAAVTKILAVKVGTSIHPAHLPELARLIYAIDLKRITRCKLASIFTSADHRKFLGLFGAMFGSEASRL